MRYVIEGLVIVLVVAFVLTRAESKHDCMRHLERASVEIATIAAHLEETRNIDETVALLRVRSHRYAQIAE